MGFQWADDSCFDPFTTFEVPYKTLPCHEIKVAVLIPKGLKPAECPVIFNVHGGFLATAHSLFAPFFSPWALRLALQNSAIIVSPDYRLLPSANGVADVLEDLEDFWQWSRSSLAEVLHQNAPGYSVDFSRLLLVGASAGGYCVLQLAQSHWDEVSALAMAYPLIDLRDDLYVKGPAPGEPTVLRYPPQDIPSKQDTMAWIDETRKTVTTKAGFERTPFCVATAQHGIFASEMLDHRNLDLPGFSPLERLRAGAKLPRMVWLLHGDDDTTVYIRGSYKFVDLLKKNLPEVTLRFDIAPGQDHAFDLDQSNQEPLSEGLDFVERAWLENLR